jgi:beta-galactosidase
MKGLVTYDREVRKDAFHWYRANWSSEPFVHLCSKRFVNRHDPHATIKAYANIDPVRLEVNGSDIGPGAGPDRVFEWEIDLADGVTGLRAVADGPHGPLTDTAELRLVEEADESYVTPEPARFTAGQDGSAARESWYEQEGLTADPSLYSTWTPIAELLENRDTRAVLIDILGQEMFDDPRFEMAGAFTLDFLSGFVPDDLSDDVLREAHERLSVIPKP